MRRALALMVITLAVGAGVDAVGPMAAWASSWTVGLRSASAATAQAMAGPAVPSGVSASCVALLGNTVKVSWSAAARSSSYTVLESTTSATGTYAAAATGLTALSWTSPSLAAGSYWFEVRAVNGANWTSAASAATAQRTVSLSIVCT